MRKNLLTLAFALLCATAKADNEAIQFTLEDGTTQTFTFDHEITLVYEGDYVIIKSKGEDYSVYFPENAYAKITLIDQPTAISNTPIANQQKCQYKVTKSGLTAAGLTAGSKVFVYNTNGILLSTTNVSAEGTVDIKIAQSGIFIIKASNTSFKIKK